MFKIDYVSRCLYWSEINLLLKSHNVRLGTKVCTIAYLLECLRSAEYSRRSRRGTVGSTLSILRPINRETQRDFSYIYVTRPCICLERASVMSTCACRLCKEFPPGVVHFSVFGEARSTRRKHSNVTSSAIVAGNKSPTWSFVDAAKIAPRLRNSGEYRGHMKVNAVIAVEGGQGRGKGRVIQLE